MKKLFTFLFALAASVGTSWAAPAVAVDGKLPKAFTVNSSGKKVYFSQGNLQYVGSWKFADNQYEYFGASQSDNHRDLFGWGTKTNPNNTSTDDDSPYLWAEWGENTITNGGTNSGWRTLTKDEWNYLFTGRDNASNLRTWATVNGVKGIILMPDGWTANGVSLTVGTGYGTNNINTTDWTTLEGQGCVFLPAAGYREGTSVDAVGSHGFYWSSSPHTSYENYAYRVFFVSDFVDPADYYFRCIGSSVRLVNETAPVTNPTVKVKGSWDDWAAAVELTDNGDGTASANVAINGGEGYYTFKFVTDEGEASEAWLSDNAAYKRNYTGKANLVETEADAMTLWVDAKGTYTFTWTYETNAFNISFPTLPTVTMKGSWDSWADAVTFTYNGDGTATATKTFDAEGYYTFKTNIGTDDWRGNGETFKRDYTGANWINDNGSDMILYVDQTGDYTFTWIYLENAIAISFPALENKSVSTNEDPNNVGVYYYSTFYDSTNKYALTNDGTEAFVATLSEDKLSLTKIAEGSDVLPANTAVILRKSGSDAAVVLTPSNEEPVTFEAVNSLMGRDAQTPLAELGLTRTTCYVLSGTNEYGVGFYHPNSDNLKAHKAYVPMTGSNNAPRRLRFVFNEEKVATGMDNVQGDNVQSTKVVRDGQLVIIRNGVEYNAAGQIVK